MTFRLKPTRMTVTDLRPSLSYRVGVPAKSRAARHWVELTLASDPGLFAFAQAEARTVANFAPVSHRFPVTGETAIIHVHPVLLLALSGATKIYAGAALFDAEDASAPLAVITPDRDAVYVAADGFSGSGIEQRFGFAGRPGLTGSNAAGLRADLFWAGDAAAPFNGAGAGPAAPISPSAKSRASAGNRDLTKKGTLPMNSPNFMHQNLHAAHTPAPSAPAAQPAPVMDYDDGFGTPPPPSPIAPAPAMSPLTEQMGSGLPYGGASGAAPAQPLDYVLPVFDDYDPAAIWAKMQEMWARYESFTMGVSDTRQFPFSAICLLHIHTPAVTGSARQSWRGTGFYIGPNLILTAAHNIATDGTWRQADSCDVYVGHTGTSSGPLVAADAISAFRVSASDWSGHPRYDLNDATKQDRDYDLAVIRTSTPAPNGLFFQLSDEPAASGKPVAVCGYAGGSKGQRAKGPDHWRNSLPHATADGRQHMDTDRIRGFLSGNERCTYNLQTLTGTSGSPVFMPQTASMAPADAAKAMTVVAVHSHGEGDYVNAGVLLTPSKRQWALSGGQSTPMGMGHAEPMAMHPDHGQPVYAEEQILPALVLWIGGLTTAEWALGIAGLGLGVQIYQGMSADDDIKWQVARMTSWLEAGASGPKDTKDAKIKNPTEYHLNLVGPKWDPTGQGMLYADFKLYFETDEYGGVGKVRMSEKPTKKKDTSTGSLAIAATINPRGGTTHYSKKDPSKQVACVELIIEYLADWSLASDEKVTIKYFIYGDATVESMVIDGANLVDGSYLTTTKYTR